MFLVHVHKRTPPAALLRRQEKRPEPGTGHDYRDTVQDVHPEMKDQIPHHLRAPEYSSVFILARMAGHPYASCANCRFNKASYNTNNYCHARNTDPHPMEPSKTTTLCVQYQPNVGT